MQSSDANDLFSTLTEVLDHCHPANWDDIVSLIYQIAARQKAPLIPANQDVLGSFARGTAFISFSYGIDGVSVEASKYAHTLYDLFSPCGDPSIHFIGGHFQPQVSSVLRDEWHRHQVDGIDGWNKWDEGRWFKALFRETMKSSSDASDLLAQEVFGQAVSIAKRLGKYILDNQIALVVPVNVASNPGNIALTLGLVLATEILGVYVLNSNHDFYWEAGKPLSEREPGEKPGVRDHFFRNIRNKAFFSLLKLLYPWNGVRWLQVNINARQSRRLIKKHDFPKEKVFEISTCVAEPFLAAYSNEDVIDSRLRMSRILSNGGAIMHPVPIADHLPRIETWMKDQQPIILGAQTGLSIDPRSEALTIMLQPTRIIGRKRIEKNLELIHALLQKSRLRDEFINHPNRQLILHVTGPTPKEHQEDLETILYAYKKVIGALPEDLAKRVFLAFSAGHTTHAYFSENEIQPLSIEALYRMANVVVFPSETEGRGLPIIEAAASGIPIVCSHYRPREVFSDVIGEDLPKNMQIRYTLFPEGKVPRAFLSDVANMIVDPESQQHRAIHNQEVIRARYSHTSLKSTFDRLLHHLIQLG